ncbi:glycosyltransferase [uncultured Chryseobacterium sp.]|uniref:glycosyltransferase n=1 Tax=uncultured Chryseobacterium sp. TaxID=259322 RepID=UPI0025E61332|nr:glycosyltransferase [uncultured Chryseobacterium sp.]
MTDRTIIFDQSIDGHHLEYVHHLFWAASENRDAEYYFILNPKFKEKKDILEWPNANNIKIDYFTGSELVNFKKNALFASFYLSRALQKRVKKFEATNIFLINIISFLPFIIFFIDKKIKVSGIVYLIYLYRWKRSNIFVKCQDILKYTLFSRLRIFDRIFLLNDNISPFYLNRKFKTKAFKYLPDPIFISFEENDKNLRDKLNIPKNQKVFLHCGALTERKGTLEILRAINSGGINNLQNFCFVFAGKVGEDIKEEFYQYVNSSDANIIVYDEYCSYQFLSDLCYSCDFILMPYKVNEQSSGILNYSALFDKKVIAVKDGLIGKIVKKYSLGYMIDESKSEKIISQLNDLEISPLITSKYVAYIKDKQIEEFTRRIL